MRILLTLLGGLAAAILICASATMNFMFARRLGHTELDGLVLGVVSVALDLLKAVLAVLVARAAADGRRAYVIVGGSVFCLITLVSLAASIGFTSNNRSAVTSSRESLNQELLLTESNLRELRLQLAAIPARRATAILDELLSATRQDRRWHETKECGEASTQSGRTYCEGFFRLRAERATAIEAQKLSASIATEERNALQLRKVGAGGESDPQARLLMAAFGLDETLVRRALMALVAIVVEIVSGLGIYLVGSHGQDGSRMLGLAWQTTKPDAEFSQPPTPSLAKEEPTIPVEPSGTRQSRARVSIGIAAPKRWSE
ncbi:MAG: hypothetical protein ABL907_14095 [Hyphomicrobium sp.]